MIFQELMELCNGNYIETAGTTAKNQCVDLANAYIRSVLKLPIIEFTNAKDFPSKGGDDYVWIPNTPTGVPEEGDLVIWSGTYGHIAIFIGGDASRFISFDENYPTGSPCHPQEHTYTNVLGWMRPKNKPQSEQNVIDELRADRDKNWNLYQGALNKQMELEGTVESKQRTIDTLTKENDTLKDRYSEALDQHTADLGVIQGLKTDVTTLTDKNTKLAEKLNTCQSAGSEQPIFIGWRKILYDLLLK